MSRNLTALGAESLDTLVARLDRAPLSLLGLGIPRCPASELLAASLPAVLEARPGLVAGYSLLGSDDWPLRETLLWPRGIRVSRSSVPALTVLRHGQAVAHRVGGGPASAIDAWLESTLGPAERPLQAGLTVNERGALAVGSARRAQHAARSGSTENGLWAFDDEGVRFR